MEVVCEMCGNEYPDALKVCPFCKTSQNKSSNPRKQSSGIIEINLEDGRPVVETALNKMSSALFRSKLSGFRVVILIHGYGSSGEGGVIRVECRKMLDYLQTKKEITGFLFGENLSTHHSQGKNWTRRYPELVKCRYLNRKNKGITVVFL